MSSMLKSPLHSWHTAHNATMAMFSQWEMPLHFESGIQTEHLHTRSHAGLFDFSHMGELLVKGQGATEALGTIITVNMQLLKPGRCRYGFLLNDEGGILDDLVIFCLKPDCFLLVVNAACREQDYSIISSLLPSTVTCEDISPKTAKFDLQGPESFHVLEQVFQAQWHKLPYYGLMEVPYDNYRLLVSRTGYTGELGVEIFLPIEHAESLWTRLLEHKSVMPIGLGARDTLRLEVGLPFYGKDIDSSHTPAEAGFSALLTSQGNYRGKAEAHTIRERLLPFFLDGAVKSGDTLHLPDDTCVGTITSSLFSPSLQKQIGLGYVQAEAMKEPTFTVKTQSGLVAATQTTLPFYKQGTARIALT